MSVDAEPCPAVHPRSPTADGSGDDIESVVDRFDDGLQRGEVDGRVVSVEKAEIEIGIGKGRSSGS